MFYYGSEVILLFPIIHNKYAIDMRLKQTPIQVSYSRDLHKYANILILFDNGNIREFVTIASEFLTFKAAISGGTGRS